MILTDDGLTYRDAPHWTDDAACAAAVETGEAPQEDWDFDPGHGGYGWTIGNAEAADMCDSCPVKAQCFADAIDRGNVTHVIQGGVPWFLGQPHPEVVTTGRLAGKAQAASRIVFDEVECGTAAQYAKHRRHKIPPCEPCTRAHSQRRNKVKRDRRKAKAAA